MAGKLGSLGGIAAAIAAGVSLAGCGSSSGDGGGGSTPREIRAVGGEGTIAGGGDGGSFLLVGSSGSDIQILRSGTVDATSPAPDFALELGTNPIIITNDLVVDSADDLLGTIDPEATFTGLHILPGATLSFDGSFCQGSCALPLLDGILIEGTLRAPSRGGGNAISTADTNGDPGPTLTLAALTVVVSESGLISTAGADGRTLEEDGKSGGGLQIAAPSIVVRGRIDASGGDGDEGGSGGNVELLTIAAGNAHLLGSIDASGGQGFFEEGGDGGDVIIRLEEVGVPLGAAFVEGSILSRGGHGRDGGGRGGDILIGSEAGDLQVPPLPFTFVEGIERSGKLGFGAIGCAATLDSSGGGGGASGGGSAGTIGIVAIGGTIRVSGSLVARGGESGGPGDLRFETRVEAGAGGQIVISNLGGPEVLGGGIAIGADMDASGGRGPTGGRAGSIAIAQLREKSLAEAEPILLVGYAVVDLSGGAGATDGGDAAAIPQTLPDPFDDIPAGIGIVNVNAGEIQLGLASGISAGPTVNEADLIARGGDGRSGHGGAGGSLLALIFSSAQDAAHLSNRGRIDLRGGAGHRGTSVVANVANVAPPELSPVEGGKGGQALFIALNAPVSNAGAIDLSGGAGDGAAAGAAGSLFIEVIGGDIANVAALTAEGGDSAGGAGGAGGTVLMLGERIRTVGDIRCRGGDGDIGGSAGFGGDAAIFGSGASVPATIMIETGDGRSEVSGRFDVRGGEGTTADGREGLFARDGVMVDLEDGVRRFGR